MGLYPSEYETIEGVSTSLRAGRTTCREVLLKCLDRIEEWEPRLRAWVRVDVDGALEQAAALDEELRAGNCRGPLHGIPIGIKDIIDVAGLPTAVGFRPWRDRVAQRDAVLVERLRQAGAVIVGKTVTTQFAWIDPPPTRNPWNLDRTPGGSSSGSAAAVAVGMCLGAIGSQTGGSIIRPASFCGVCGLKPAYVEVSHIGVFPFAPSLDHPGPIARSVRDLRLLFEAIASGEMVLAGGAPAVRPRRLLRLRGFCDRRAQGCMTGALERALAALVDAGAEIVDLPDDELDLESIIRDHRTVMCVETASVHELRLAEYPGDYAPQITALIKEGLATPAARYQEARAAQPLRRAILDALFSRSGGGDALVMPATIGPAPDPTSTGDPAFNSPWSYVGRPAVSFPIGLSPEGLPLAIQLVAAPDGAGWTGPLLETAFWCEGVIRASVTARSD
jgi:aspartyl-tRNA(Asn)/glutamyl-tRNA(Gln) amidotransferase subunit A